MKTILRVFLILLLSQWSTAFAGAPKALYDFEADVTSGCSGLKVTFSDISFEDLIDPIMSREWDFGDGSSVFEFSPEHTYAAPGVYTVKMMIVTAFGNKDTVEKTAYIKVSAPFTLDLGPDVSFCSGSSIILDATVSGATDYLWSDNTNTPDLEIFTENEYWVEVTKGYCVKRDTIYVSQTPLLFADFSYESGSGCSPVEVKFTESSQACSGTITNWTWDFGDGSSSTQKNPKHFYATPGEYEVKLTVKNNSGVTYTAGQTITVDGVESPVVNLGPDVAVCDLTDGLIHAGNPGATYLWNTGETTEEVDASLGGKYSVIVTKDGCTAKDTVVIDPLIKADFTHATLVGCLPVKIKFTDKSTTCNGAIAAWEWKFADGQTSSQQNPEHDYTSGGDFSVRLTVTHSNGDIATRTIKVTVAPVSVQVNLGADTTICAGDEVTLDAGNNPGASYLWNNGKTTRKIKIDAAGQYSVKVGLNGCEVKDTIKVSTMAASTVKFAYAKGQNCLPVSVQFSDSSTAGCGQSITGWKWDFGDGTTSTLQNPLHEFHIADSFVVKLVITTSSGTSSGSKKIGIESTSFAADLPATITACKGSTIHLDAGVDGALYAWSPATGLSSVSVKNPELTPVANMLYRVSVTRCMVTTTDSVYILVDSVVKPTISRENNILKSSESISYQWMSNDADIAGAVNRDLKVSKAGYYKVRVGNASGCKNESEAFFYIPKAEGGKKDSISMVCSPNPANGVITILLSDIPQKPSRVSIMDSHGKRYLTTYISNNVNKIDVSKLPAGLYFIEASINNRRKVVSVVLQ